MPGPRYDYGLPNDVTSLTNWANTLQSQLGRAHTWERGIQSEFRIIEGEHANFARFKFTHPSEKKPVIWDLLPGPQTQFGPSYMSYHLSGALTGVGTETYIRPGQEKGDAPGVEFSTPTEALSRYVSKSLTSPELKSLYPYDPMKRLGLMLYKGTEVGVGVTGGQIGYNVYHTQEFVREMSKSVAVGVDPEVLDREAALKAVYNAATAYSVSDPTSPWAALRTYVPSKSSGNIIRLQHVNTLAITQGHNLSQVAISTEGKQAIEDAPREFLKRRRYSSTLREEAFLYGYQQDVGVHQMDPGYITGPSSQPGYRYLNLMQAGETERPRAYVRPGMALTSGSPVPGIGIYYGPEGFPKHTRMAGQTSHHEVMLPPVPIQEVPSMDLQFGIYRRKELTDARRYELAQAGIYDPPDVEYKRMRGLKGAEIGAGESAIIGLMKYTTEGGERITQEIGYRAGATPHAFTDLPTLRFPRDIEIASGKGSSGFGVPPYYMKAVPFAAAASQKFGIPAFAESKGGEPYLDFPIAKGVQPGLKGMGFKIGMQEAEVPTGMRSADVAPVVSLGGEKVQITGFTGELKNRVRHFKYGVFGSAWPEMQMELAGELANVPGGDQRHRALARAVQGYIGSLQTGDKPGAPSEEMLSTLYSAYMGTPYHEKTGTDYMMNLMRMAVERPGYEETAIRKYGHAKMPATWFHFGLGNEAVYRSFEKYAKPGTIKRDVSQINLADPMGSGILGALKFKSPYLYSTLAAPITPEYQSGIPQMGTEARAAMQMQFPELAEAAGFSLLQGREGVLKSGYGFERPEVSGWQQINELGRVLQGTKSGRFEAQRPVGAIDMTQELADALKVAMSTASPKELNYGVLEEAIESIYGKGEQLIWDPRNKRAMLRPSAVQKTATSRYPEESPFYNLLSTVASSYPYALDQFVEEWENPQTGFGKQQQDAGLLKTSLNSFYRDVSEIFSSRGREVEKTLQSLTSAGLIGGRYLWSGAAGMKGAVINRPQTSTFLSNASSQAALTGQDRGDFIYNASQQLQQGPIPAMFWRFPIIMKPGGVIPTNLVTSDYMRRSGVAVPEGRTVEGGKVSPGSVFATNMPFMIGMQYMPHVGDLDLDPGQILALARATPAGLVTPQDPRLISALANPERKTLAQYLKTLAMGFGTKGKVAGGQFNINYDAMSGVGAPVKEPAMVNVPRENWWATGVSDLGSYQGMGMEYNMRRLFEATAGALGFSGDAIGVGHTTAALRYQEFLDKLSSTMKNTTTMVYTSHFDIDKKITGDWRLSAMMGQGGAWKDLLKAGPRGGEGSWGNFVNYASSALQRDIDEQIKSGDLTQFSYEYPSYLMTMRERDIPRLKEFITSKGGVHAGVIAYADWYRQETGLPYDPSQTILGTATVMSAVSKGEPWGNRKPRLVETVQGEKKDTFTALAGQSIKFLGQETDLAALPATPTAQAIEGAYGYLTRKYPTTKIQSGLIYGITKDILPVTGEVPLPFQGILSRYPAAQESAEIAKGIAMRQMGFLGGDLSSAVAWLDPERQAARYGYAPQYIASKTIDFVNADDATVKNVLNWWKKNQPGPSRRVPNFWDPKGLHGAATGAPASPESDGEGNKSYGNMGRYIVGEDGPEMITFNTPASIYPANMTRANAMGMNKTQMGDWATNQLRGMATGGPGGIDPQAWKQAIAAAQGQPQGFVPFEQADLMRNVYETQIAAMQAGVLNIQTSSLHPRLEPLGMVSRVNKGLIAMQDITRPGPRGLTSSAVQALGVDITGTTPGGQSMAFYPELWVSQAVESGDTEALDKLWAANQKQIKSKAARFRQFQTLQNVLGTPEAGDLMTEEQQVQAQGLFQLNLTGTQGRGGMLEARLATAIESYAKAPGGPGSTGRSSRLAKLVGDVPEISMDKFSKAVEEATTNIEKYNETITKYGEGSPRGQMAAQGLQRQEGRIRAAEAQMMMPVAANAYESAQAAYAADPTAENAQALVQSAQAVRAYATQYRTGTAAGQAGRYGPQAASRFTRGLIGGWGLMYMGHLAQFPMATAQFGFAEAEAYQQQMAAAAGGQFGPSVQPAPSVSMQMYQGQLRYGGQGFGAYQSAQANMSPFARDIQGTAMAGAAGGALGLYFSSVAQGAGLPAVAGGFAAAAPWMAGAAAIGYAGLQAYSWRTQPEQTIVSYGSQMMQYADQVAVPREQYGIDVTGLPTLASLGASFRYLAMRPEDKTRAKQITQQMYTFREGGQPYHFLSPENAPVAAQMYAAEVPEGYDPDIAGQTFLRLQGIGTDEQILESTWAQQRGIDLPGLSRGLLQASRQRYSREAAGDIELEGLTAIPTEGAAATQLAGQEVMARLPVSLLKQMYGENYATLRTTESISAYAYSDMAQLVYKEGQLQYSADQLGIQRTANVQLLDKVKRGTATPREIRELSVAQARDERSQTIAQQIGYHAPWLTQSAFDGAQVSAQAEEMYASAAASMGQARKLGIGSGQFLSQMTKRELQGNLLGQQALGMTAQYARWGGQDTGQFFSWTSASLENQTMAQRLMSMDPLGFADAAMGYGGNAPVPGMAQFAQTVDVGLGGELTGLSWGTTSLASVGRSAESNAQAIFGNVGIGSAWRNAAVEGFTNRYGKTYGGTRGLNWYMRETQYEAQQASMGAAMAQIALQEEYMPQFWAIQDQQRALSHEQRLYGFDMQQRQFRMQGQQFQENMGLQRRQQFMQRGWAQEDWAFQDQTRTLQWGWKVEDFEENVRFMTGRQRKLAERQMERDTTMHGIEGERIDTMRERQKEMWSLEDQRFEMTKKHHTEQRTLQEENMKKQREFYDEGKKLQDEMIKLQREYQMKQLELQKASIGAQAEAARKMKDAQDAMQAIADRAQDASGEFNLAKSRQVDMINTIVRGMNHLIKEIPGAFDAMAKGLIPLFSLGGNGSSGGGGHDYRQTGGSTMPGKLTFVGEEGIEAIRSSVPQHVFPSNETFAAQIGGPDNISDPWSQSFISTSQHGDSTGGKVGTVVINIGNERLAEYVLNTVNDALEVN